MSATLVTPKTTSGGEIIRELVNASDGAGLHFDGSGVVAFTPVDLGSKFSHEFVLSASEDLTTGTSSYIVDYHRSSGVPVTTDRFIIGFNPSEDSGNLAIYDNTGWESFGVNPLTDRKIHHLVVTVDGTSAKLFDNGNLVGTADISSSHGIDGTTNAGLAGYYNNSNNFEGTIYRARSYNKALTSAEVQTAYERADVDFADQYGSQTELITSSSNRDFASGTGNWGANGITLVNDSGLLKVAQTNAYDPSDDLAAFSNGRLFLEKSYFSDPPNGKRYRLTLSAKATTSGSKLYFNFQSGSTTDISLNQVVTLTDSLATYSFDILPTHGNQPTYILLGLDTAETYWIDNVSLVRIGCVSDYDLAFANPTQSRTVQDRSTNNVDGTASTSGVTQVQPVVQLNATAARIGTSAGTPAERELLLDKFLTFSNNGGTITSANTTGELTIAGGNATNNGGNISLRGGSHGTPNTIRMRVGGTTALTIASTGNVGINCDNPTVGQLQIDQSSGSTLALTRTAGATTGTLGLVRFGNTDVDSNLANILVYQDNATDAAAIAFQTQATGGDAATRLTIGSNGICTFSNGIAFPAPDPASAGTPAASSVLNVYEEGTWTPTAGGDSTYTAQTGRYTRVGRLVTCSFDLTINARTGSTYIVSGLPFSAASGENIGAGGSIIYYASLNVAPVNFSPTVAGSTVHIRSATAAATSPSNHGLLASGSRIAGIVTYTV